ncbi:MAG: hypothetical protein JXO44_01405 [Clostridia bacterium]|nr:hypothetical protein [Clostridia bacterium]
MGQYFTREYVKIKQHKNKIREVKEETVLKAFLNGDTEVEIVLEDSDQRIIIDYFSDPAVIRQYLGEKFVPKL